MPDNSKPATRAIAELYRDMAAINRLAKQPHQSMLEQMENAMESLHFQHLGICQDLEMRQVTQAKGIISAFQHWHEIFKKDIARTRVVESFTAAHQSWLENIKPFQGNSSKSLQLRADLGLALHNASQRLFVAEQFMLEIDFEAIRSRFQIEMPVISGLENSLENVVTSYGSLSHSMWRISDITRLPAFVLPGATREIYTNSFALDTLCHWDEQDENESKTKNQLVADLEVETSSCIALLRQVDPRLAQPYIGAHDALYGNNTDRARHILSSLRELWNHLLRRLAPDESVIAWIPESANQKNMLHKGKPTRQAKVLYICRELNKGSLAEFMVHDTQALVKLIHLFNKVHKLDNELTNEQLRAILLRTDSWLMYILQISLQKPNS